MRLPIKEKEKDFKLVKKELLSKEKIYTLSMQLIKRESI